MADLEILSIRPGKKDEVGVLSVRRSTPAPEAQPLAIRPAPTPDGLLLTPDPSKVPDWSKIDPPLQGDALTQMINVPLIPGFAVAAGAGVAAKAIAPLARPLAKATGELGAKMISGETTLLIRELGTRALNESSRYSTKAGEYFAKYGEYPAVAEAAVKQAAKRGETWAKDLLKYVSENLGLLTAREAVETGGTAISDAESKVLLGGESAVIKPLSTPTTISSLPGLRPEKFATPEQQAVSDAVIKLVPEDALATASRGTQTGAEAVEAAKRMGWNKDVVLSLKPGQAFNAEQNKAITGVYVEELDKLTRLTKALDTATRSGDEMTANAVRSSWLQQKVDVVKLAIKRSSSATESGRALRALQDQYEGIDSVSSALAKKLTKVDDATRDLVLAKLREVGNDPEQVYQLLQKLDRWGVRPMFMEAATAAKLWGITTQVTNVATELARGLYQAPIRLTAGILDKVGDSALKVIYGEGRQRWAGEAAADLHGMASGVKTGIAKAVQALGSEKTAMEAAGSQGLGVNTIAIKGRPGKDAAVDKFLDFLGPKVRFSFRMLGIGDSFVRPIVQQGAFRALVYRDLVQQGLKPGTKAFIEAEARTLSNPSFELLTKAQSEGEISMFRAQVPEWAQRFKYFREAVPELKLLVPFVDIGVNLVREGMRMNPITAWALPSTYKALSTRGPAMDVAARLVLGTSAVLPLTLYALKDENNITLAAPKDPAKAKQFYREGNVPYAIKINGKSYPFSRAEPFAQWLVTAKLMADMYQNDKLKSSSELLTQFALAQGKNIMDKTFMQGVSDAVMAASNPTQYGDKFVRNVLTGAVVPTIISGAARAKDPVFRVQDSIIDAFKAKMPGFSESLLPQRGTFGEPLVRPGNALQRLASPIVPSPSKADPVDSFLKAANIDVGMPARLSKTGKPLSPEEYDKLMQFSGPVIKRYIELNIPRYQSWMQKGDYEGVTKDLNGFISQVRSLATNLDPLVVVPELRALKIDPKTVPPELYPVLRQFMELQVYKNADDTRGKQGALLTAIRYHKQKVGR